MILITGAGLVGLNTAKYLLDQGQKVLLVRRRPFEAPSFLAPYVDKEAKAAQGDITELPFLYRLLREYNVQSIIHAAVLNERKNANLYQSIKVNISGTAEILEAARILGIQRVTCISSGLVSNPTAKVDALQEDMDLPAEVRGWVPGTKRAMEQVCQLYAHAHDLSVPVVRPAAVWGPLYWTGARPINLMVDAAIAGKPLDLSHLCALTRSNHTYVRDIAKAIGMVHLAPSLNHSIYNASYGELHSYGDFVQAIKEVIPGTQIKLGTTRSENDVDQTVASIDRIKEDVGFLPDYDIKKGVRAYIEWVRDGKYN